jgi:hypothetical protein
VTELEERVRMLEAELATASQQGDSRRIAEVLAPLGSNLEAIGQRARGIETLKQCVALYEELGDLGGLAEALNRLGSSIPKERPDEARRS